MKYLKFEKLDTTEFRVVRVTYLKWWGKQITRDAFIPINHVNLWRWLDTNELIYHSEPIQAFWLADLKQYNINGTKSVLKMFNPPPPALDKKMSNDFDPLFAEVKSKNVTLIHHSTSSLIELKIFYDGVEESIKMDYYEFKSLIELINQIKI